MARFDKTPARGVLCAITSPTARLFVERGASAYVAILNRGDVILVTDIDTVSSSEIDTRNVQALTRYGLLWLRWFTGFGFVAPKHKERQ